MIYECFVSGTPGPQGSKRIGRNRKTRKLLLVESSKKVKPWRHAVEAAFFGKPKMPSPVHIELVFVLKRPLKRKTEVLVVSRPDLDKLCRSTFDGLKMSGIISDDSIISNVCAVKIYTSESVPTGAFISIHHSHKMPMWAHNLMERVRSY